LIPNILTDISDQNNIPDFILCTVRPITTMGYMGPVSACQHGML